MNTMVRHNDYLGMRLTAKGKLYAAEPCVKSIDSSKENQFGWPFRGKEVTGEEAVRRR